LPSTIKHYGIGSLVAAHAYRRNGAGTASTPAVLAPEDDPHSPLSAATQNTPAFECAQPVSASCHFLSELPRALHADGSTQANQEKAAEQTAAPPALHCLMTTRAIASRNGLRKQVHFAPTRTWNQPVRRSFTPTRHWTRGKHWREQEGSRRHPSNL